MFFEGRGLKLKNDKSALVIAADEERLDQTGMCSATRQSGRAGWEGESGTCRAILEAPPGHEPVHFSRRGREWRESDGGRRQLPAGGGMNAGEADDRPAKEEREGGVYHQAKIDS